MTTDINQMYQTLTDYMNYQVEVFNKPEEDSYADYETDIYVDAFLYNKDTFDYIVDNMCKYPNKLIEYDSSTLSIRLIKDNYLFEIQGYPSMDELEEDDDGEDVEFVITVEIKPC